MSQLDQERIDQIIPTLNSKQVSKRQVRTCRECGCTNARACLGGCFWVGWDLCSRCYSDIKEYHKQLQEQGNLNPDVQTPSISDELIKLLKMDGINSKALAIQILENLKKYEVYTDHT